MSLRPHRRESAASQTAVHPTSERSPATTVQLSLPTPRRSTPIATTALPFHHLRHTCATLLLTKRVHPKIVSQILGHSSVSVTLDMYSHMIPGL